MKYSAFARYGFLRYVGGDEIPEPQKHYNALAAQLGTAFDLTPGFPNSEDNEAELFANAMNLGRASATLKKAGYQRDVTKVTDMLPLQEQSYLATPLPTDTIYKRQQRLAALKALPGGAITSNLTSVLTATLGAAFLKLRVLSLVAGESAADMPTSNFQPLNLEGKWLQLVAPLGLTGSQWASYGPLDPTLPLENPLAVGDKITVQAENNMQAEVTTVTGLRTLSGIAQFQATFANAHDQGASVLTSCVPRWTSSQGMLIVELAAAAAIDPPTRAKVDAIMAKVCRGTCQWATVAASGVGGDLGPFTCNVTPIGTATVGPLPA